MELTEEEVLQILKMKKAFMAGASLVCFLLLLGFVLLPCKRKFLSNQHADDGPDGE